MINILKNFRLKIICLLLACIAFVKLTSGQDTLTLSCTKAIEIALSESYSAHSYELEKQAMQFFFKYNKAMFRPRLDFTMSSPLWQESVSTIYQANGLPVYNSNGLMQVGSDINFTYVLPTGGNLSFVSNLYRQNVSTVLSSSGEKLSNNQFYSQFGVQFDQPIFSKNKLRQNLREAEYKYQKSAHYYTRAQMDIVFNVTQEFYALYKYKKQVEIAEEKLRNSVESYRIAKLKSKGGRIAQGDEMSAEVSVAQNEAGLLKEINQLQNEEDLFKQLIGIDLKQNIGIITNLEYKPILIDEQKAVEEAIQNRLELKEADMDINLQQIELDRAKQERGLKGKVSAYYDLTGISTSTGVSSTSELMRSSFDDLHNRPPTRGIALTLTLPIYDWGRGSSKVHEAGLRLQIKEQQKSDLKISIQREVREIIRSVNESSEQLKIHSKNLELARQTYKISQKRFENGDLSNLELTVEQERLANIQLEYLDSFINYQLATNDLKRKTVWDFEKNKSYAVKAKVNGFH